MARATDLGDYFRIRADNRDLNYNKFFSEGDNMIKTVAEYTSHNTARLDIEGVKKLLLKLGSLQEQC
jgi:UDP-glucose 4-epimerase